MRSAWHLYSRYTGFKFTVTDLNIDPVSRTHLLYTPYQVPIRSTHDGVPARERRQRVNSSQSRLQNSQP